MSFPEANIPEQEIPGPEEPKNKPDFKTILKHVALFAATFICVTYVGIFWVGQTATADSISDMLPEGALFAVLLLGFLAAHEFGHYFAAVYHKVRVSLPYFIPIPIGIGTMGAVIRIKEQIKNTRKLFDVGISGPVAGFVVAIAILLYGFSTLPGPEYIENFAGHEEVISQIQETGTFPDEPPAVSEDAGLIILGDTLLYSFLASFFDNVPPMYEMYHYPFLFAGWLALFFTALNLMPIGQLDGGHILYSLVGYKKHRQIARICFGALTVLAGIEAIPFLYVQLDSWFPGYGLVSTLMWAGVLFFLLRKGFNGAHEWIAPVWTASLILSIGYLYISGTGFEQLGSLIWVVWCFFLVYFVKMEHPPVIYEEPLTPRRRILGWISMVIFVLCISPAPISMVN